LQEIVEHQLLRSREFSRNRASATSPTPQNVLFAYFFVFLHVSISSLPSNRAFYWRFLTFLQHLFLLTRSTPLDVQERQKLGYGMHGNLGVFFIFEFFDGWKWNKRTIDER
jgi:hypothetical protein